MTFDQVALLAHVDGDIELLGEIIELFRQDTPRTLLRLREALDDEEGEAVWQQAHALKGAVANFAASSAHELALHIENAGRAGDLGTAARHTEALAIEIEALLTDLDRWVAELS